MINVIVVVIAVLVALSISWVMKRRAPEPPTQGGFHVPTQLDRADFPQSSTPWLIAVFTSATCDACQDVVSKAVVMRSEQVSVVNIEYQTDKPVHERYAIDAVPTLVVADRDGVVRAGFIGPIKAQDLWAAVAECREPGSTPEPHLGRDQLDNNQ
jgi:hypothetical protein